MILGARYGFALHAKSPAYQAQVELPLVFSEETPLREILSAALGRSGREFQEDVIITDRDYQLLGLVSSERLANLQTKLVSEQVQRLDRKNDQLRRSAVALEEARGLWMGLFESSLVGVALVNVKGGFISMNRCCSDLLNMSGIPASRLTLGDILSDGSPSAVAELLSYVHKGGGRRIERRLRVPGRGERLFRLDLNWIEETSQHCLCFDDITEQRALEQRMRQNEKQLLFDTLVAGIAHELNNKITPVMGFAELLLSLEKDETSKTYLDCIRTSMEESASIIHQLLHLSRPETGRLVKVDLRELVEEVLLMLKFQLSKGRVELDCHLPEEPLCVLVDASQIKQVIINLAINSVHAMEQSAAPRLLLQVASEGSHAAIRISDNGCGIPRELQARIFDPFFTTKGPDKGSGLGLSVCLSIARQHRGSLTVDSEAGQGATFTLSLPLGHEQLDGAVVSAFQGACGASGLPESSARPVRPELRVLIVDDEEPVRRLMGELLVRRFQCSVDTIPSADEGLELALNSDYALIVSDVRMPGMDGGEFYQRLRECRPGMERNFFLTTGYAGAEGEDELTARLEVPVLRKPFAASRFLDLCRPYLECA
jgi:signal transduction histidine kinase/CheY-like chemotaxis protein